MCAKHKALLTPKQLPKDIGSMTVIPWENRQEKENRPLQCNLSVMYVHSTFTHIHQLHQKRDISWRSCQVLRGKAFKQ